MGSDFISQRELNIRGNYICIQETECGYISPYSLFMIDNFPLNFSTYTKLCDYGAGTGILGIVASLYGVADITSIENNDECYSLMKSNYSTNIASSVKLSFYKSETECLNSFDVIICNPASLPNFINSNSFCDGGVYGIDMILKVLDFASKHICKRGKLYIIITSILPLSVIKEKMLDLNLKYSIIATKVIPFREHYRGISDWVDQNQNRFPEMYYINYNEKLYEELFLFEIEKEGV